MKILMLCHNLTGGGAERVAASLANGLSRKGHEILLLTDLSQPVTYGTDGAVRLVQAAKRPNAFLRRVACIRQIRGILNAERPDAIISILAYLAVEARIATWTSRHCPIIQSDHNAFERPAGHPFPFRQRFRKFWENYLYEHVTVLTEADKAYLGGRFRSIAVMPNPLFLKPAETLPRKRKTILAVGRMDAWRVKGFDVLLSAWNGLAEKYPDWKLRIVGAGREESIAYLKGLAAYPDRVDMVPYTDNIADEYRAAEIFVLSSRYEGFGLVLIEAMSQGCACIACDYKGRQAEIVHDGDSGLLCPPDDRKELADRMERLIADAALRLRLQRNAMRAVDRYSEERIAGRWEEFIRMAVEERTE